MVQKNWKYSVLSRAWFSAVSLFVFTLIFVGSTLVSASPVLAQDGQPPAWRRIRTNSVPHRPQNLTIDSTGTVWVTAYEDTEYSPGVWRLPAGDSSNRFEYLTDNRRNNYLTGIYNNVVEKPMLAGNVRYAIKDKDGNAWYALNDRRVLCEKADGSWHTFSMKDTSYPGGSITTGVDSVHKIRLIDNQDGTQDKMMVTYSHIRRIDSAFNEVETRDARSTYNNDAIYDALIDSKGRYWVASGRGVETGDTIFNTYFVSLMDAYKDDPEVPPYETSITGIQEDSLGNIWFINFSYDASGVYCLTAADDWLKFDIHALTGASNHATCMAAATNGTMLFGFNQYSGIVYTTDSGKTWGRTTCASLGLESELIAGMAEKDGVLWFVTDYLASVSGNGTGIHSVPLANLALPDPPPATSYTHRGSSTTLTSNRINRIAGDLSGGIWFAAYDEPSVARMKADGTWVQYREDTMDLVYERGSGGISGIGVDSSNIVYMAPNRRAPIAYDIPSEQWLVLPAGPPADTYFYNLYVDPKDGKWFCGSENVYHLNADNSAWKIYDTRDTARFPDYRVQYALMDGQENMWFMTTFVLYPAMVSLMRKDPAGGEPTWFVFKNGDDSGFQGGPRLYLDKEGRVWNSASQVFDSDTNAWITQTDTTPFDTRPMRFLNGDLPSTMSFDDDSIPLTSIDQDGMTVDTDGNVYFSGGMGGVGSVNIGIVVLSPVKGDIDRDGLIKLNDAVMAVQSMTGTASRVQSSPADINGDGKVDASETIYILQKVAQDR